MGNALKIQGALRYILQGLEHINFSEKDIVGSDIKDDKGTVIGVIIGVDFDNDLWYGELFDTVVKLIAAQWRTPHPGICARFAMS